MEEMLEDTLESVDEDTELEEEAEEEVDRVLFEITDGKLGVAGAGKELPVRLLCWCIRDLTLGLDAQRPGGSCKRCGYGPDAGPAQQSSQWIDTDRYYFCSCCLDSLYDCFSQPHA